MRARSIGLAVAATVFGITISAATLNNTGTEEQKEGPDSVGSEDVLAMLGIGSDARNPAPLALRVPEQGPLLREADEHMPPPVPKGGVRAHAYQYVSRVFDRPKKKPRAVGFVRRNIVLEAGQRASGPGCAGIWYRTSPQGYLCSRDGFAITREVQDEYQRQPVPNVDAALPYRYGKAASNEVLRYYRIPTPEEEQQALAALTAGERLPEVVERQMDGVYLLALDREEQDADRSFFRTVRGRYVRVEEVEPKPNPGMRGELLEGDRKLPIAFVYGDGAAKLVRREGSGHLRTVGAAEVHARFQVADEQTWKGKPVVISREGVAVDRERVRMARRIERPKGVGAQDKWIHVNLDEQALVAYEGDRPVFATLVSSGKGAEFATPKGLFQMREKHISTTMSGPDPDAGYYEVEEVPWTMFYYDSYALHGAYWHNDFGKTRSHGCTNLSPIDARWLFYWSDDRLPPGWHALRKLKGTHVYITRDLPPQ